jgi:hypothetical protein
MAFPDDIKPTLSFAGLSTRISEHGLRIETFRPLCLRYLGGLFAWSFGRTTGTCLFGFLFGLLLSAALCSHLKPDLRKLDQSSYVLPGFVRRRNLRRGSVTTCTGPRRRSTSRPPSCCSENQPPTMELRSRWSRLFGEAVEQPEPVHWLACPSSRCTCSERLPVLADTHRSDSCTRCRPDQLLRTRSPRLLPRRPWFHIIRPPRA